MALSHTAFIFPAFVNDFSDLPGENFPGYSEQFNLFLNEAGNIIDLPPGDFNLSSGNHPGDELMVQYYTYLCSCAASVILRKMQIRPEFTAGYSMGIYAALFDAGSITLETGLLLIRNAFQSLRSAITGTACGMAALIGLDRNDIEQLILKSDLRIEITNQNATHSFVLSGLLSDVSALLIAAREEGALHTRDFPVSVPYHYSLLERGANVFAGTMAGLQIAPASNPVLSLIDRKELLSPDDLRNELVRNLYHPLNWLKTQEYLMQLGISRFIECGPSKSLKKNARFIQGDYSFLTLDEISTFFLSASAS